MTAALDARMTPVPLHAISLELDHAAGVHLVSTDRHRFTRWDTTATWPEPTRRVLIPAAAFAAAARVLARQDTGTPVTMAVTAHYLLHSERSLRLSADVPAGHITIDIDSIEGFRHFPTLNPAVIGGPRRIDLTRTAATSLARLARLARAAADRHGPDTDLQLNQRGDQLVVTDRRLALHLGDVPAHFSTTPDATAGTTPNSNQDAVPAWAGRDVDVILNASYLADTLTTLNGAITLTSPQPNGPDQDDRTLPWTFTGTAADVRVVMAPVYPAGPRP